MQSRSLGKVALLGCTGVGKSTVGNFILNNQSFQTGDADCEDSVQGVTKDIISKIGYFRGYGGVIEVLDSPGWGDLDVPLDKLIDKWNAKFSTEKFRALIMVKKITDHRVDRNEIALVEVLKKLEYSWDNFLVVFSHVDQLESRKSPEIAARNFLKTFNEKCSLSLQKYTFFCSDSPDPGLDDIEEFLMSKTDKAVKKINKEEVKIVVNEVIGSLVGCFASDSLVERRFRTNENCFKTELVPIEKIRLLDSVRVPDGSFEEVMTVTSHLEEEGPYEMIHIKTDQVSLSEGGLSGSLCLTPGHFVFLQRGEKKHHLPARLAQIGDLMTFKDNQGNLVQTPITAIEMKRVPRIVNIRTPSLSVVVNGIAASCAVEGDAGPQMHQLGVFTYKYIHPQLPHLFNQFLNFIHQKQSTLLTSSWRKSNFRTLNNLINS